jgi:hypothetical protein
LTERIWVGRVCRRGWKNELREDNGVSPTSCRFGRKTAG